MRRLAGVLVLAVAFGLAGCEDVVDPGGLGTFTLVEANGQPLPAVVFDGDTPFGHMVATAVSGSITLRESTYTERVVFDVTLEGDPFPGTAEPVILSGEWEQDGQLLTFHPDRADAVDFTGTLSGDVLTTVEQDPDFGELSLVWER